jgi:hypothetical protein
MHATRTRLLALAAIATPALASPPIPPDPQPQWFKGNLHTHTLWSDGNDFPEMVVEWYRDHGYNFLALSDHNTLSQGQKWMKIADVDKRSGGDAFPKYLARFGPSWVETRGSRDDNTLEVRLKPIDEYRALVDERGVFTMIQGEEVTGSFQRRPIHINATNLGDLIPPQQGDTAEEVIRHVLQAVNAHAEQSGREVLTHLNHPNFGWGVTAEDLAPVLEEHFFEVFNGHAATHADGNDTHASTDQIWDIVNTIRMTRLDAPPLCALAVDDSHSYHGHSNVSVPGRGWIMVRATHLTPESLIRAINAGDFYASSGVTLESIDFDGDTYTIRIESAGGEQFTTRFIGTLKGADLTSQPVTDDDGNEIVATRRYSPEIGKVLAEVPGTTATYHLTGHELYIRAVILSDAQPEFPSPENTRKRAWTQPVVPHP